MLGVQIVTGVVLAMHYTPHVDLAFKSVESIMRDVNFGWLLRYLHANGASMFFLAVYIHMFRGIYYGSYKEPREVLWILGVIIYLLMMATGFMGYVLVWGQMSFWAATVITNLFSAIPGVGDTIVTWLWGGFAVGNPTLNRFYSLHYLLPFVIAGVVVLHIWALHVAGQNNPTGIEPKSDKDTVAFTPYATVKDGFFMAVFCILFAWFVFYIPNFLGHADNYIPANPAVTPADIVPEWYYLPFYAILRVDPGQADGRDRAVLVDRGAGLHAVARHLAGALGALPSAVQAVLLAVGDRLHRARLARLEAARGHLRHPVAHLHRLLLRLLPDRHAAARHLRENQAAAEFDFGIGLGRESVSGAHCHDDEAYHSRSHARRRGRRARVARDGRGARGAAKAEVVVSPGRSGNMTRRSSSAASRSTTRSARSVIRCRWWRSAISRSRRPGFSEAQAAAVAAEYKIKDLDDKGRADRARRPAGRLFPVTVPERTRGEGGAWRRSAGHVDACQGAHL